MKYFLFYIMLIPTLFLFPDLSGQDTLKKKTDYPAGFYVEFGWGKIGVKDQYISGEKYSGGLPYFGLGWVGAASSSYPTGAEGEYQLPSGKIIYIGTGYFERYDGQIFEWNGIPPEIRIENTPAEIESGKDRQLEYSIELINSK